MEHYARRKLINTGKAIQVIFSHLERKTHDKSVYLKPQEQGRFSSSKAWSKSSFLGYSTGATNTDMA